MFASCCWRAVVDRGRQANWYLADLEEGEAMRVSTKGRYGLRVMIELASREGDGPVMMSTISECQKLSRKYLHSILTSLKNAGLVRAVRGARGGYLLARSAADITARQVLHALEGSFAPVECLHDSSLCDRTRECVAREVWQRMEDSLEQMLSHVNLQQLVRRQEQLAHRELMYFI